MISKLTMLAFVWWETKIPEEMNLEIVMNAQALMASDLGNGAWLRIQLKLLKFYFQTKAFQYLIKVWIHWLWLLCQWNWIENRVEKSFQSSIKRIFLLDLNWKTWADVCNVEKQKHSRKEPWKAIFTFTAFQCFSRFKRLVDHLFHFLIKKLAGKEHRVDHVNWSLKNVLCAFDFYFFRFSWFWILCKSMVGLTNEPLTKLTLFKILPIF